MKYFIIKDLDYNHTYAASVVNATGYLGSCTFIGRITRLKDGDELIGFNLTQKDIRIEITKKTYDAIIKFSK